MLNCERKVYFLPSLSEKTKKKACTYGAHSLTSMYSLIVSTYIVRLEVIAHAQNVAAIVDLIRIHAACTLFPSAGHTISLTTPK